MAQSLDLTTVSWDKDQPAVEYMRELIFQYFPAVALFHDASLTVNSGKKVRNHSMHGVGGRVPRETEAGKVSRHTFGIAADIYVDARNAYLKRFGDELFSRLVENASVLQLSQVIWNLRIWSINHPTVRAFDPKRSHLKPHTDHMHVEFTRLGSQSQPPLLEDLVKQAAKIADRKF